MEFLEREFAQEARDEALTAASEARRRVRVVVDVVADIRLRPVPWMQGKAKHADRVGGCAQLAIRCASASD